MDEASVGKQARPMEAVTWTNNHLYTPIQPFVIINPWIEPVTFRSILWLNINNGRENGSFGRVSLWP